jgi:hypothetical protein
MKQKPEFLEKFPLDAELSANNTKMKNIIFGYFFKTEIS